MKQEGDGAAERKLHFQCVLTANKQRTKLGTLSISLLYQMNSLTFSNRTAKFSFLTLIMSTLALIHLNKMAPWNSN